VRAKVDFPEAGIPAMPTRRRAGADLVKMSHLEQSKLAYY
jgi:hypothetical protein